MRKYSTEQITVTSIIVLGIITSFVQFLYNPSFGHDEVAVALNIIRRNSYELLKPLNYLQSAPVLFLQIEKLFSTVWPNTEYGLRLFPLLCFWASIGVFHQIIKKQLDNIYARTVALSFFALGCMFIDYSNEVKQYMSDTFVLLCVFYLLLKDYKKDGNKYWLLGIIGVLAIFLSNVAPIILFVCGIYLVYDLLFASQRKIISRKKSTIPLFIVFAVWLSTFLLYYCFFIYKHPLQEFMVTFWSLSGAFLPSDPLTFDFYKFLFEKVPVTIFSALFALNESKMQTKIVVLGLMLLFTTGIIDLIRRKNVKIIMISCIPILLHLLLSSFQLYPFARRLILYTLPGIIIVCAFGFDYILNVIFTKLRIVKIKSYALVSFIFIICLQLFVRFPIRKEIGIKECIKYMQNNANADQHIYNFLSAALVFQYYKDIGVANSELSEIEPLDCERYYKRYIMNYEYLQSDLYLNDLKKQLRNEVWLLSIWSGDDVIINKIDSLGYNKIREFKAKDASVYLYDFGE